MKREAQTQTTHFFSFSHIHLGSGRSEIWRDSALEVMELKEDADRDGTRDPRAACGCGEEGGAACRCKKLGVPPFVMPAGWEPPTTKRAE